MGYLTPASPSVYATLRRQAFKVATAMMLRPQFKPSPGTRVPALSPPDEEQARRPSASLAWLALRGRPNDGGLDVPGAECGTTCRHDLVASENPAPATPPAPAPPQGTPTTIVVKRVGITQIATLASPRTCVSRRKFPIRLRRVKADRIVRAQIKLNGKQVRNVTGRALGLPIDLRGLPKGRFTVEIVTTDQAGQRLIGKRAYRTCVPKRRQTQPRPSRSGRRA